MLQIYDEIFKKKKTNTHTHTHINLAKAGQLMWHFARKGSGFRIVWLFFMD